MFGGLHGFHRHMTAASSTTRPFYSHAYWSQTSTTGYPSNPGPDPELPRAPRFCDHNCTPHPESGTATTMIQKASKKVLRGRVQAAVLGYGQLYQTWVPAKAHSAGSPCSSKAAWISPGPSAFGSSRLRKTESWRKRQGSTRWTRLADFGPRG